VSDPFLHFLSFVRFGLARLIEGTSLPTGSLRAKQSLIPVRVSGSAAQTFAALRVDLRGPADVVALNASVAGGGSCVRRVSPPPGAQDFSASAFVAMDLDQVDLPWLYTPVAASNSRLPPWLCLLVIEQGAASEGQLLGAADRKARYPRARVEDIVEIDGGTPLPDLAESWATAHVQVASTLADRAGFSVTRTNRLSAVEAERLLAEHPELATARLLCLRRLKPGTQYRALLVPAFATGVAAGLGIPPATDESGSAPAWSGTTAPAGNMTLPVFASWPFATAVERVDFEEIVARIRPEEFPDSGGTFQGEAHSERTAAVFPIRFEGMVMAPNAEHAAWPGEAGAYVDELKSQLNAGLTPIQPAEPYQDPLFAPPVYGRWHARVKSLGAARARWVEDLNLDPRYRYAASLGTSAVQAEQETLMGEAWAQVGQVRAANEALRAAQAGAFMSESVLQRVARLDEPRRLNMTALVHGRIAGAARTVAAELTGTTLPMRAISPAFQRVARPDGPLFRRVHARDARSPALRTALQGWSTAAVSRVAPKPRDGALRWTALPAVSAPTPGPVLPGPVLPGAMLPGPTLPALTLPAPSLATPRPVSIAVPAVGVVEAAAAVRGPVSLLRAVFSVPAAPARIVLPRADLASAWSRVSAALEPRSAIARALFDRLSLPRSNARTRELLHPIMAHPVFPEATSAALARQASDAFLPGVDALGREVVVCGETNPSAVHAFLAGMNHEMGRELLWRGYPTDCRGTYFRRFWDRRAGATLLDDISQMHAWSKRLGANVAASAPNGAEAILVIRSALFEKFPNTHVYAVPAVIVNGVRKPGNLDDESRQIAPAFQGWLGRDIRYFGFPFQPSVAIAGEGMYFVFVEQSAEARFGLDEQRADRAPLKSWDALAWNDVGVEPGAYLTLAAAPSVARPAPPDVGGRRVNNPSWGVDAAATAAILLQRPIRAIVHASRLFR
jgi:hypothetical protein